MPELPEVEITARLLDAALTGAQVEALAELARRLRDRRDDPAVLAELRSEAHKVRGSAGSYGFDQATAVAAEIEEAAKLWLAGGGGDDRAATAVWLVDRLRLTFGPSFGATQVPEIFVVEDHAPIGALGDSLRRKLGSRTVTVLGVEGWPACGTPLEALRVLADLKKKAT